MKRAAASVPLWLDKRFPKSRPPLPTAYQAIYLPEYKRNRNACGLKYKLETWMHRQVGPHDGVESGPVLEIGAGTLNHLPWEPEVADYDIVEPFTDLYEHQPERRRVRHVYHDIADIAEEAHYARILSIATLEHVLDLPAVIARAALLLSPEGRLSAAIPSEGGLLWYLAWRFGTGLSFTLRTGLDYGKLMHYEHVNNAAEILAVTQAFFDQVTVRRFPLPWHHFSFYTAFEASGPRRAVARKCLEKHS